MAEHKSRYALKLQRGRQMYGPGKPGSCCAHKLQYVEVDYENNKRKAIYARFTTERTARPN